MAAISSHCRYTGAQKRNPCLSKVGAHEGVGPVVHAACGGGLAIGVSELDVHDHSLVFRSVESSHHQPAVHRHFCLHDNTVGRESNLDFVLVFAVRFVRNWSPGVGGHGLCCGAEHPLGGQFEAGLANAELQGF